MANAAAAACDNGQLGRIGEGRQAEQARQASCRLELQEVERVMGIEPT
jgi:hypothetical protein